MIGKLLGVVFDAQSAPREAQEPPKSSQNGAPNANKSMLKNDKFFASIFRGFGLRFGGVFERFFEPVETSRACVPKVVWCQQNISFIGTEETSALLRYKQFWAKIDEKTLIFKDLDFKGVWGGFWETKNIDFRTFFDVFSMQNLECNLEEQKIEKKQKGTKRQISTSWRQVGGASPFPGESQR